MRSLKRIITVLLALAMILTSVGIGAFAADFSDITDQKVAEAVDKLVGFNIITGYEDGTFRPDNQITRAEFAAIVTRYKRIADNLGADAVTGFADLDADDSRAWARPYVKAAVDAKIINGFDDGTFRAGEPVTYEQAVKMLVCAAGYEVVAQSELNKIKITNPDATWSAGYIAAANKHGITKGVITAQISEPASRGVVAVLTSNTIDVPELKENEDGTFEKVEEGETDQTVEEIKGVVSGTYLTGLNAATVDLGQNEIMIGTGEDKQTYELTNELRDSLDFEDLIGKNVVAYYDKLDRQITSVVPRNNTSTVIKEQDVISIDGNTVKYYNANGKSDSVSLSGYTKIYNGKYLANDHTIIENLDTNFKNGQIELIEAGGQKIAKITSYDVFVVNSKTFNDTEERVYFKYNKTYKGNGYYDFPAATSSKPEVYVNGAKKDVSGSLFNEWTVINLLESPNVGGNKINRMYVTSGRKTGKITEGIDEERMVIMDGKEIYLTSDYSVNPDKVNFELNQTYEYYLDYTGQIAAVNKKAAVSTTKYDTGYIIAADDEQVGLILKDGTYAAVTMKKNVKLDGVSTDRDEIQTKLKAIAALMGSTGCYQPVKYNITSSELVALDTIADSNGAKATAIGTNSDDMFIYNASDDSVQASTSSVTIDGILYNFSSTTTVIYVPDTKSSTADYSVMSPSTAFAVKTDRKIEVFGADPAERTKDATVVLMYGADPAYTFTGKTPYMVVTRQISGGEKIEGYLEGSTTPTTLTVSEEKFKKPTANCVDSSAVAKGDIIRYIKNGNDIIAIEMVYDADGAGKLGIAGDKMAYDAYTANVGELHLKYAEAFDMPDGQNKLSVTQNMGSTFNDAEKQAGDMFFQYATSSSTVVYRISGGNVVADNALDNISISADSPSEVIVFTRNSSSDSTQNAKAIYIVK